MRKIIDFRHVQTCFYRFSFYALDEEELEKMQNRIDTLQTETETQKTIHLTLITLNGVTPGSDTHNIQSMLTMDDLFV